MTTADVLDLPAGTSPDPEEFLRAAMRWHFDRETGSPFWLRRAASLDFDPRLDVKSHDDLALFPNVVAELRDVPVADLIPRGYGAGAVPPPDVVGIFESGGTTGAPKRVVCLADWLDRLVDWCDTSLDAHGFPRGAQWLGVTPSGPHIVGRLFERSARSHGRFGFTVDLDPRWVRKLIAAGRHAEADDYAEHVVDQVHLVLATQDVEVLTITPALLERLARRDDLVALVNEKIRAIRWGGTQMDPDTAEIYRGEVFPDAVLYGHYGSTMVLGIAVQRPGDTGGECVFDPFAPYNTFGVVDPGTGRPVPFGSRGQVVMHHVSRSMLLPNNLERDLATRVPPPPGGVGDAVADIAPVATFESERVIEGVY